MKEPRRVTTSTTAPTPAPAPVPPAPEGPDLSHDWVGPAMVKLTPKQADIANFRGSIRLKVETRLDILDVYCENCRRHKDDVGDKDCEAKIDNTHLIGGDQRERKKRKRGPGLPANAVVVPGPRINRRGIAGVLSREA